MDLNQIKQLASERKKRKRVGRGEGSGHGKTSTKGHHGQKSRTGGRPKPQYIGGQTPFALRIPKRGFNNARFRREYAIVNVRDLEKLEEGTEITPEVLLAKGLIRDLKDGVKVLGDGELSKKLVVKAHKFSELAREKIQAQGGSAVEL